MRFYRWEGCVFSEQLTGGDGSVADSCGCQMWLTSRRLTSSQTSSLTSSSAAHRLAVHHRRIVRQLKDLLKILRILCIFQIHFTDYTVQTTHLDNTHCWIQSIVFKRKQKM